MPSQKFQVLQCYSCSTFQVQQKKLVNKWTCKMCGEKQSVKKVYSDGSGAECRIHVQSLNTLRGKVETARTLNNHVKDNELASRKKICGDQLDKASCWNCYMEEDEGENLSSDSDEDPRVMTMYKTETKFIKQKNTRHRSNPYRKKQRLDDTGENMCAQSIVQAEPSFCVSKEVPDHIPNEPVTHKPVRPNPDASKWLSFMDDCDDNSDDTDEKDVSTQEWSNTLLARVPGTSAHVRSESISTKMYNKYSNSSTGNPGKWTGYYNNNQSFPQTERMSTTSYKPGCNNSQKTGALFTSEINTDCDLLVPWENLVNEDRVKLDSVSITNCEKVNDAESPYPNNAVTFCVNKESPSKTATTKSITVREFTTSSQLKNSLSEQTSLVDHEKYKVDIFKISEIEDNDLDLNF